ncbi:conjugal transfer protein TrbF [Rhodovulum sp. P5]|uniref:conjugal transfer protein TrbF n=1 Tax=Rhodovulum sp. P5 TaxID=1564506 RepID=UPI001C12C3FA|nr:conjugal transfer protein TrbF [Rhodovulum sp. P5]
MSLFKRAAAHYGKTPDPETPYQKAAQVWDERIGSARVQAKNWRLMAFGCLILAGGLATALVWQSARGTVVPYVVEIDRHGEARAVEAASAGYRPSDPQIAWHLARFIEEVRGLPADPIVVRQNWLRAYEFTTDRGALALNDHARANDPLTRVGEDQVSVEVSSIRLDQAVLGVQTRSALTSAFAVSISLRMIATMATFAGLPAARRASYFAFRSGLYRIATSAGM